MSSSIAGRLADGASRGAAALWRLGFAAAYPRGRAEPLAPAGGERVAVVAPHPDDEAAGCAGTLLLHAEAGDEVTVLVATDGRGSRAFGLPPDEMARRRRAETERAARALGVAALEWIGLPEGGGDDDALRERIARSLAGRAVVYAPSRVDYHPEHARVAALLAAVLESAPSPPLVRVYQVHVPLARPLVNRVADVSRHAGAIWNVLSSYETQWGSLERTLRLRRYAAARHGLPALAEEFWELSAAAFVRLARARAGGEAPFRGMRRRAFSDPLAFLAGRLARRALSDEARG